MQYTTGRIYYFDYKLVAEIMNHKQYHWKWLSKTNTSGHSFYFDFCITVIRSISSDNVPLLHTENMNWLLL